MTNAFSEHFDKYIDKLTALESVIKLILEGDHFSNTLFYRHKISLYENMLEFSNNDCGPKKKTTLASVGDAR